MIQKNKAWMYQYSEISLYLFNFFFFSFFAQLEQFPIMDMYDAFEFDSVKSSHPIYVPVENPDQINEIFDKISYSKVCNFTHMK